jgi:amino acid transporter
VSATGLVRSWAVRDGAVYAVLSTNFVTLGMVEFANSSSIPRGQLVTSVLISGLWVSFLVVTYAGLIVTVPRAGGDYIWQSRLLSGAIGFVVSSTGLWFILWLWTPIYGTILSEELFQPVAVDLGQRGTAQWFASSNGRFVASLVTIALAGVVVAIGMAGYARVQLWCLGGGMAGFLLMVAVLIVFGQGRFEASVDHYGAQCFHLRDAYKVTLAAGGSSSHFGLTPLGASLRLVPMMMFYLLWPNTGSSLYGEIKGADEFGRVLTGMLSGLWVTVALSVVFLLLVDKTFGWSFYNDANAAWAHGKGILGVFPYPALLAGWLVHNQAFQLMLVLVMSLWFLGWVGTLFLSSTRVIFAAAYDRVLPDAVAMVSDKRHVPVVALVLMLLPAIGVSALYAYWGKFSTFTLDAVLVVAVTYFFSSLVAVILPWRSPELWRLSPASRVRIFGVPIVPVAGLVTMALLGFSLYEWLSSSAYGVNAPTSLIFMGSLYVLAYLVYASARWARRRQGIDLRAILRKIPDE